MASIAHPVKFFCFSPRVLPTVSLVFLLLGLPGAATENQAPEFRPLFNGTDLAGWSGDPGFWSVRDGAIIGQTSPEKPLTTNTFLIWQGGEVANFELRAKFRIIADNDKNSANSGVQYRSRVIDPATWTVGGYQADMDAANQYTGMLYEEKGRGILVRPGERIQIGQSGVDGKPRLTSLGTPADPAKLKAAVHAGDWNDIVIIAEGNHIRHFVNGHLTAEAVDLDDAKCAKTGVIALQLHTGPPMTIQFKDIFIKVLAPCEAR